MPIMLGVRRLKYMLEALDIFISYSSVDRVYAEKLARELRFWGMKVWWDEWEIRVGDSLTEKIQQGLESAAWLAVVLTPSSIASSWVKVELAAALGRELESREVVVLPLLFRDCDVPIFLRDKKYADFRESFDLGLQQLLQTVRPPLDLNVVNRLLSESKTKILAAYSRINEKDRKLYVDHLVGRLTSESSVDRRSAVYALWAVGADVLPVALVQCLSDSSQSVRRQAVFLMGETRNAIFRQSVAALMSDGNPDIRHAARQADAKLRA
jgi:hypothetical protein